MTTIRHLTERCIRANWSVAGGDTSSATFRPVGCLTKIITTWHATINYLVPIGYEDETGFHYGESPATNRHAE